MKNSNPQVLVLGATGMLGRTVYKYLLKTIGRNIYGTSRKYQNKSSTFFSRSIDPVPNWYGIDSHAKQNVNNSHGKSRTNWCEDKPLGYEKVLDKNLIYFNLVKSKDTENLFKKKNFDFVINCIGALKGSPNKKLKLLNIIFPRTLFLLSNKYKFKVINISTDAVFGDTQGKVYENSVPTPSDYYDESKLVGEILNNAINIRTSILGLDPFDHKGHLELVLRSKSKEIIGFTNQAWSGSTTLQLAQFIEWIISDNIFLHLQEKSKIIHFAPLTSTKYKILQTFSKLINGPRIKKCKGSLQTRILKTIYIEEIKLKRYTINLEGALRELIKFDQNYVNSYKKS